MDEYVRNFIADHESVGGVRTFEPGHVSRYWFTSKESRAWSAHTFESFSATLNYELVSYAHPTKTGGSIYLDETDVANFLAGFGKERTTDN